jgi:hypothetical protein
MPEDTGEPGQRGTFHFQVFNGSITNAAQNVNALRQMWLDRTLIDGDDIGPGDPHDFDDGAWHSSCHLMGAGGVRENADGRLMWLEISHDPTHDEYFASLSIREPALSKAARSGNTGALLAISDPPIESGRWCLRRM